MDETAEQLTVSFFIPGTPKPQPRTRSCIRGNRSGVYDPTPAGDWKLLVYEACRKTTPPEPFDGGVSVSVFFLFLRPMSHYRTGKNSHLLKNSAPEHPTAMSIGDSDNLSKIILDVMTGVGGWWKDDGQAIDLAISKRYAEAQDASGCFVVVRVADVPVAVFQPLKEKP